MRTTVFFLAAMSLLLVPQAVAADSPANGDAAFSAGDFANAERAYGEASPNDAAALAGLARIRLYQERRAEAKDLAGKALAADAGNVLAGRVLAAVAQRDASFGADVYRMSMHGPSTIRFVATDPLPVVNVTVNGRKAAFLIDTGAPDLVLDADFAKEIGVAAGAVQQGTFAGGQRAMAARALLPRFGIGAVRVQNVPVALMPTRGRAPTPGMRIDGVVGCGFLQHFLATLDYAHGALILRPRTASQAVEASAAKRGSTVVPMWLVGDHFIFARARMGDGPEGLFNIDTGLAGGGLQATKATLDAAHIVADEGQARTGRGPGGDVRIIPFRAGASLGGITEADVAGIYTPDGDQFGLFPFRVAGTLSHQFFRKHALTLDFEAMRLVVE